MLFRSIYPVDKNPIPWFNEMISGREHSNFFERRGTAYAKGTIDTNQMSFEGFTDDDISG